MSGEDVALITVASVQGAATLALVGVTFWYAKTTRSMARAAREQAEASVKMAEAFLCPVLELWMRDYPLPDPGRTGRIEVKYANRGNGPAKRIHWLLQTVDGGLVKSHVRQSMGTREEEAQVEFDVDETLMKGGLSVVAEYESVFGDLWRSSLSLKPEPIQGKPHLVGRDFDIERIDRRSG